MGKMLKCGGLGLQCCQSPPKESPKCPSSMNFKPVSSRSLIFALHDCTKTLMRDFDDDICYNWGIHPPYTDLDSLPGILQKKYALLRDLDKSLQDIQRQNEHRCEREIEEIRRGVRSGNVTPNTSFVRFSDDALDEQKHSVRIADEKVALAVQAYDLVDTHIQQLDQYLKKFDEDLRREREAAAASAVPAPSLDGSTKVGRGSEGGRGGRKKTRQATAAAAAAATTASNPTGMDLDLPVDPNEPTYCFCNQVSYGEMVACDNPDCKIEWFHFGCVGLKEQPKGKWYCSDCATVKSRRKGR